MDRETIEQFVRKNWIGLAILAVGFTSFAFVGIKAISQISGNSTDSVQVSKQEVKNFKAGDTQARATAKKDPAPKFKRNIKIKEGNITGAWQADIKSGKLLLQLKRGQYKLVIFPASGGNRLYSNGTYTLNADILHFKPDISIKAPKSDVASYSFLTRSPFPVMVTKNRSNLVFQRPVAAANVYVPNVHPLLKRTDYDLVVFDVLK